MSPELGYDRRPRNWIGWLFLAAGLALGLSNFQLSMGCMPWPQYPVLSLPGGRPAVQLDLRDPLRHAGLGILLFPTGRPRSRRWRVATWPRHRLTSAATMTIKLRLAGMTVEDLVQAKRAFGELQVDA
jgi:hypothetical protein